MTQPNQHESEKSARELIAEAAKQQNASQYGLTYMRHSGAWCASMSWEASDAHVSMHLGRADGYAETPMAAAHACLQMAAAKRDKSRRRAMEMVAMARHQVGLLERCIINL